MNMNRLAVQSILLLFLAVIVGCGGGGGNPIGILKPPQIVGFYPQSGGPGTQVQLWGAYFGASQGSSTVYFNYIPCQVNYWSDTVINCNIPNSARTSGSFVVSVNGKTSAPSAQFTLLGLQITSVSPSGGPAGTLVTISGTGFGKQNDNSRVTFNGCPAEEIVNWSPYSITCYVPECSSGGSVSLVVRVDYDYYISTTFNYILPLITGIGPVDANTTGNNVGAKIAIKGQGFGNTQYEYNGRLTFDDSSLLPLQWSPNLITFVIPPTSEGTHRVAVTIGKKSSIVAWNVYRPVISNPNPSKVYNQGETVTLFGQYLGLSTDAVSRSVKFGDTIITSSAWNWSDTSISFANPIPSTLFSDPTVSVTVTVGGLTSDPISVKID